MNEAIKKGWPHVLAVVLFFALAAIYFAPELFDGKGLVQGDVNSAMGWGKDIADHYFKTGEHAHWSARMFGGMPHNYTQSAPMVNIFDYLSRGLAYLLSFNSRLVFLYLIGFYIFMIALGCRPALSAIGAVAYAFASYNLIIIEAGQVNKCLVMATMAPILGGVILCYRKKYLWGSIVTLLFTGLNVLWSHQQISYYLLIMMLILALTYFVFAIRNHTLGDFFKSSAVLAVVGALAVAPAAGQLISSADYVKDSMRGGAVLKSNAEGAKESSGLEIDYAYMWSYGRGETMTLLIPNFYGSDSHHNIGTDSHTYQFFSSHGQSDQGRQFTRFAPMYWGDQPFTSGPVYVGAIICFLFVLGLMIVKGPERWWLLAVTIVSFILSWGKNAGINEFLFYHLPLYNKFRTPSMALVIAEVSMVALAVLAVKQFLEAEDKRKLLRPLYISAGITGGLCLLYALLGGGLMSFSGTADEQFKQYPDLLMALVADRQSMLSADAWRSFGFIAAVAVLLWIYAKKPFNATYVAAILGVLVFADLWAVDKRFLNYEDFVPQRQAREIVATEADKQILQDKDPNYRVLNLTKSTFNESETSYFHKSVGGYSPAKLRRYQDIIDFHFAAKGINTNVLNMLNTRYVIVPTEQGPQVQRNPNAPGCVWFVDEIRWVDSPDAEIVALNDFNPVRTAVIDKAWQSSLPSWQQLVQPSPDSTATIRLTDYPAPDHLIYESQTSRPRLAVFSEVFYKTWHAYIDGKEVKPVRVDYILRGLEIPAGTHKIEFRCVDDVYLRSARISLIASIVVGCAFLVLIGLAVRSAVVQKS